MLAAAAFQEEYMMVKKDAKQKKVRITNCETCEADLDEDEMSAFLRGSDFSCGFYQADDEYAVVRKQM